MRLSLIRQSLSGSVVNWTCHFMNVNSPFNVQETPSQFLGLVLFNYLLHSPDPVLSGGFNQSIKQSINQQIDQLINQISNYSINHLIIYGRLVILHFSFISFPSFLKSYFRSPSISLKFFY